VTRLITSQIIPSFVYPKGTYELKGAKSNANMPAANFLSSLTGCGLFQCSLFEFSIIAAID
jgi:hypothetical protein